MAPIVLATRNGRQSHPICCKIRLGDVLAPAKHRVRRQKSVWRQAELLPSKHVHRHVTQPGKILVFRAQLILSQKWRLGRNTLCGVAGSRTHYEPLFMTGNSSTHGQVAFEEWGDGKLGKSACTAQAEAAGKIRQILHCFKRSTRFGLWSHSHHDTDVHFLSCKRCCHGIKNRLFLTIRFPHSRDQLENVPARR